MADNGSNSGSGGSGGGSSGSSWSTFISGFVRAFLIYSVVSSVLGHLNKGKGSGGGGGGGRGGGDQEGEQGLEVGMGMGMGEERERVFYYPAVTTGDVLNIQVFVTDWQTGRNFGRTEAEAEAEAESVSSLTPVWQYTSFIAGAEEDVYSDLVDVTLDQVPVEQRELEVKEEEIRKEEGVVGRGKGPHAHVFLDYVGGKTSEGIPIRKHMRLSYPLVTYREKKVKKNTKRLLGAEEDEGEEEREGEGEGEGKVKWVPYWKGNMTVSIIPHNDVYQVGQHVMPPLDQFLLHDPETNTYPPFVYLNNFWLLDENMVELNETTLAAQNFTLGIRLHELSLWKANVYMQMEQNFKIQEKMGLSSRRQSEDLKRMFLETNPIFLGITTFVSLLHTIFDMLAFRSDIGFWSKNESMKGLSARTIIINCSCQIVIFLYLLENETSNLILFSNGLGLLIEMWKVTKATKVEFTLLKGVIPFLTIKDRDSYAGTSTKVYDQEASKYLSYALYPLVLGYSVYSLMYETHESWYAWILSSLVGAVYTFGFILMCPQLYINYRMKSVAHLPWRQMTYKFLNTIIDDLFAFVIKMPTLHRLSVFRDDIIFLIYLYQRWIYRVDKTRTNEFGYSEAEPEKLAGEGDGELKQKVVEDESKKDK